MRISTIPHLFRSSIGWLLACGMIAFVQFAYAADPVKRVEPMPLVVKSQPLAGAGVPDCKSFSDEAQIEKAFGKGAVTFTAPVDFSALDAVLVTYGTSGPPFGKLAHKTNDQGEISFYVDEPKVAQRGQAFKLGADWFSVPKGTKVRFLKSAP